MRKFVILFLLLFTLMFLGCSYNRSNYSSVKKSNKIKKTDILQNRDTTTSKDEKSKEETAKKESEKVSALPFNLHGIPVLYYHSIAYEKGNPIRMPKDQFEAEMKYIKDNGYTTITLDELYDYFQNSIMVPDKSIVLAFDDGYEDNYTTSFPILKKYGFKATIFVITSTIDKDPSYLTSEQMKEMEAYGFKMESHTVTHRDLDSLSYDEQYKELSESKAALEKLLKRPINYAAYPSGKNNAATVKAAKAAGYTLAFTTAGRWSDKSDGMLTLDRVYISTFYSMQIFIDRLTNPNYKIY